MKRSCASPDVGSSSRVWADMSSKVPVGLPELRVGGGEVGAVHAGDDVAHLAIDYSDGNREVAALGLPSRLISEP